MVEELLDKLSKSNWERLKWLVLREFSVLPGSREARRMKNCDYLACALQMLLDLRGRGGEQAERNPAFDIERFERLRRECP